MKNMRFSEFLTMMYEKREIVFSYAGRTYNFELSGQKINIYELFEDRDGVKVYDESIDEKSYIDQIDKIIEAKLFDGKSLMEMENGITVLSNS